STSTFLPSTSTEPVLEIQIFMLGASVDVTGDAVVTEVLSSELEQRHAVRCALQQRTVSTMGSFTRRPLPSAPRLWWLGSDARSPHGGTGSVRPPVDRCG